MDACRALPPNLSTAIPPTTRAQFALHNTSDMRRRHAAQQQKEAQQRDAATTTPATESIPSRLMSLPAELRNRIWTAAFEGWTQRIDFHSRAEIWTNAEKTYRRQPPLLSTCKQIYAEAIGIYYSTAIFFVDRLKHEWCRGELSGWLRSIGPERAKLVRNVRFHLCRNARAIVDLHDDDTWSYTSALNHDSRLQEAERDIKAFSSDEMVIKADLWYQTEWDRILIWTSTPVSTDQEVHRLREQRDEGFDKWLEAKAADVKIWELRGISEKGLREIDAHETYRDRIE
ncbi:hypothetical protein CBER1_04085 [Cercospora berteroae]|uniref:2EXR domain-containing protein n=1 Tax=Cercospora berteroae TaxID=357750 RepID=A0A2S6CGV9_9PEZI|nr:hypothetical protein CBER1_04085 [Cercospora berteroae]